MMTTTATTTTKAGTLLAGRSGLGAARRSISDNFKKKASAGHSAFGHLTDGWREPNNRAALRVRYPAGACRPAAAAAMATTWTTATTDDALD